MRTQHQPGSGSRRAVRPRTLRPSRTPWTIARFMPQVASRWVAARSWNGQLPGRTSPASSRPGSYPSLDSATHAVASGSFGAPPAAESETVCPSSAPRSCAFAACGGPVRPARRWPGSLWTCSRPYSKTNDSLRKALTTMPSDVRLTRISFTKSESAHAVCSSSLGRGHVAAGCPCSEYRGCPRSSSAGHFQRPAPAFRGLHARDLWGARARP